MKLSIFPKAKPLPSSQEEKAKEAKFTAKPHKPEIREFVTEDDLIDLITSFSWSPFIYKEYRRESDFISTDLLVFDIDEGQTIEEAEDIVKDLNVTCLCLPTTSHKDSHHKFRLLFPLSKTITNIDEYKSTYAKYAKYFTTDPACTDAARFYFGSTVDDGFFWESELLRPVHSKPRKASERSYDHRDIVEVGEDIEELTTHLYGEKRKKVPEGISYFLQNAPNNLDGEWYSSSNSFLFSCGLSGLDHDKILDVFYKLYPHEVTPTVEKMVDKAIKQGYDNREEK